MSDTEQLALQIGPIIEGIVAGALKVSGSGFFGKLKEGGAVLGYLAEASDKFDDNALVQHILANFTGGDLRSIDLGKVEPQNALADASQLGSILSSVAGGEQVKQFVLELIEQVFVASGSGLFGGGEKVSPAEQQFYEELNSQLG